METDSKNGLNEDLVVDVFWSFRSPWSYLATPRLASWQQRYNLSVRFRPVYPIAIRSPEFFSTVNPLWTSYFMTDLMRVAQYLEIPISWPNPDPVASVRTDEGIHYPQEQPHIHRLTQLGILAQEMGAGIGFAEAVSTLIWTGTDNWHTGGHLADAVAKAGLNLHEMDERRAAEEERLEQAIKDNEAAHEASGHWGVPTCVFNNEPFFGQDRLDVLLWRLQQEGLQER